MKSQKLFSTILSLCICMISCTQQPSKNVSDKGIFPEPDKSPSEAVTPSLAEKEVFPSSPDGPTEAVIPSLADDNTDSTDDGSTNPANPSGDKEYTPSSHSSNSPKGDKEYFPAN